jgi:hypothetical protein
MRGWTASAISELQEESAMSILRNMGAVVLGLLPLIVGCAQPFAHEQEEEVGVVKQANGGGSTNGYDDGIAHGCWDDILQAMSMPLVTMNGALHVLNPSLPDSVEPGGACQEALQYAYRCAGEDNTTLPVPLPYDPEDYAGEELMATGTGWVDAALTNAQKRDILTCMITHVNNQSLDICIFGANVSTGTCFSAQVHEAVWRASLTRSGVEFDVWLLDPGTLCDAGLAQQVLEERLCSWDPDACYVNLRDDLATSCTEQDGEYNCSGPTVKTTLPLDSYLTLYPSCPPPPQ